MGYAPDTALSGSQPWVMRKKSLELFSQIRTAKNRASLNVGWGRKIEFSCQQTPTFRAAYDAYARLCSRSYGPRSSTLCNLDEVSIRIVRANLHHAQGQHTLSVPYDM